MYKYILVFFTFFLFSCENSGDRESLSKQTTDKETEILPGNESEKENSSVKKEESKHSKATLIHGKDTLVPVNHFNKNIYWELKYATTDNFMHRVLYDTLDQVYVQIAVARRLAKCQEKLSAEHPDYHLLVYDGLRPLSVQWEMWNGLDTIPPGERGKFVSNPVNGSVHNYGAAVDLTICNGKRVALDMGAGYDDIRKIAYPSLEAKFLASGELTKQHVANRNLLRKVMRSQQFSNIPSEWWHFNAYSRAVVKTKYNIVNNELKL